MNEKTNIWLIEYAKGQVGRPYWYGTFGSYSDKDLYKAKKAQYPKQYPPQKWTEDSFMSQLGVKVHDCVGLIKGALWCDSTNGKPKYNSEQDVSADGLINLCKEWGPMYSLPEIGGLVLWKSGHVGIYLTGGKVVEAKGHAYGVVISDIGSTNWQKWGRIPWIQYVDSKAYVQHLYECVLARKADEDGLAFWVDGLNKKTFTVNDVALSFFASPEFIKRNLSDADFIRCVYKTFFNREPDSSGFAYWTNELKTRSRLQIVIAFIYSPEWLEKSKYICLI